MKLPSVNLDEQAIRRAFEKRAKGDKVDFWSVAPEQIHRDLYGIETTRVAVRFIGEVRDAMLKELIRAEIERLTVQTPCDLTDINPRRVMVDKRWNFESLTWDVLYAMMVEEAHAARAGEEEDDA